MSLILEALKKSEANRRLGQAPDLGTPFTPARRERSPLWALLVIFASLGAGAWWWFGRGASAPAPPVAATTAPAPAITPPLRAEPARSAPTRKPAPAIVDAGATGFGPLPPGSPRQAALGQQEADQRIFGAARRREENAHGTPADANEQIWVAAQRQHDAPARSSAPSAAAQPKPEPAPTAQPARAPKTANMRGYTPPPQPHPEAAPPAAPAVPKLDVPTYYDLPFATRKALPQLSLSMHVYTADPKQRFVILDGTRMGEGDATSDNITVREIRPDGVVLEFQGQRFFYPRDGL